MKTSIIATLLCASAAAASAQQLLVEYEGTVSSIERGSSLAELPPYSMGDAIKGSLIVDLTLAPRDMHPDDPQIGRYYDPNPGLDFILGPAQSAGRASEDFVVVYDDWAPSTGAPREDGIVINDSSFGTDGDFNLVLGLQRPNLLGQLLPDDGIGQSFDVRPEPGVNLWGYIERGFGEFWRIVNFTLDRFSVTPGVCRP